MDNVYLGIQAVLTGLAIGSLYGLVGLGFTLIYKATKVVNFAQGEAVMIGAYAGLVFYSLFGLPYPIVMVLVLGCGALFGVLTDRVVKRLIEAPAISLILLTVGLSMTVKAIARLIVGSHPKHFPQVFPTKPLYIGKIIMSVQGMWFIGVLAISVMLFYLFFFKTKTGLKMRAVSQNRSASWLMGITVPKVFLLTWAISGAIGALGGLLFAPIVMVDPDIGMLLLLPAISASVLGGFGSLQGVLAGGWIIGVSENIIGVFVGPEAKEFVPFLVLFLTLVIKPSGLFRAER
jgi:branched-chain amino acid transport system permease protein